MCRAQLPSRVTRQTPAFDSCDFPQAYDELLTRGVVDEHLRGAGLNAIDAVETVNDLVPVPRSIGGRLSAEADGLVKGHGLVKVRDHAPDKGQADDLAWPLDAGRLAQGCSAGHEPCTRGDHGLENEVSVHCGIIKHITFNTPAAELGSPAILTSRPAPRISVRMSLVMATHPLTSYN